MGPQTDPPPSENGRDATSPSIQSDTRPTPQGDPAEYAEYQLWRVRLQGKPFTIYLSDEREHWRVELAVRDALHEAGIQVLFADDPVIGSWFRTLWGRVNPMRHRDTAISAARTLGHMTDARLIQELDAKVTANLMMNVGPIIASLQYTKDAVIRLGAVLIVKSEWQLVTLQLSAEQQFLLDHYPSLLKSPAEILQVLEADTGASLRSPDQGQGQRQSQLSADPYSSYDMPDAQ